jgi:methyl-accepting chemotaxis protein
MRKSLSKLFIFRVILVLLVCQGILFAWSYYQEQISLQDGLNQKVRVVSRLIENAAIKGLTEFDVTYLGLLTDEMLKDPDFTGVMLFDDAELSVVERKKPGAVHVNKVTVPVSQGGKALGRLEIFFTTTRIEQLLFERLMIKAVMQAGILVLIAVFIYFYFRARVARRIVTMEQVIGQLTAGDLSVRINDQFHDELGAISAGIDILGQRQAESVTRISALSKRVANTTADLNEAFTATKTALSHQHDATEEITRSVSAATGSQTQISLNARRLLEFSRGNATTLAENLALSQGIASRIDTLHEGMNDAYGTLQVLDRSAKNMASHASLASEAVDHAVGSAAEIRYSYDEIERIVAESARLSEHTTQVVTDKGIGAVADTQESMSKIHALSDSLRMTIGKLGDGSKDIAKIITVISEITNKTKLLSLNASIIAAQAGEHGLGFAVVANEMQLLSDKTAHSTTEISSILGTIHHDIADAVREAVEATKIVQEGSRVVTHAGLALQEILSASKSSQETVVYIKEATGLQQERLQQVVDALDKLREVSIAVSQSSSTEETNIRAVGSTIGELRDAMEHVRSSTDQQVASMRDMLKNVEVATGRTSEIANAVHEGQQVNGAICASLREVVDIGAQTVSALTGATDRLDVISCEIDKMQDEMKQYKL